MVSPLQTTLDTGWIISATGFTVIVNTSTVPVQLTPLYVNVGVTIIVAIEGDVPEFNVVKVGISPVPEAPIPIVGLELVQEYVVNPIVFAVEKTIALTESPLHLVISLTEFIWAAGFTVMVNVLIVPEQDNPAFVYVGVTLIVATTGVAPELSAVNEGVIELLPDAANPILVVSFVQV